MCIRDRFNTTGIGLRSFGVNACGDKRLGKEAVTLVDFFGYLAAHIGQMENCLLYTSFIVSTPDYFRYNPADEFITPEQIEEIAARCV